MLFTKIKTLVFMNNGLNQSNVFIFVSKKLWIDIHFMLHKCFYWLLSRGKEKIFRNIKLYYSLFYDVFNVMGEKYPFIYIYK